MKDQSIIPDSTRTVNPDSLDSGIQRIALVPVLQLPVLHMEEQMSVVITIVIVMPPGPMVHSVTDKQTNV